MCEETKKLENLENTELTDEQMEAVAGGETEVEDIKEILYKKRKEGPLGDF